MAFTTFRKNQIAFSASKRYFFSMYITSFYVYRRIILLTFSRVIDFNKEKGEVMFKEDGVSGICVMDLSIYQTEEKELSFDFLDDYSFEMLKMVVNRKLKNDPYVHLHNLLFGSVNGLNPFFSCTSLSMKELLQFTAFPLAESSKTPFSSYIDNEYFPLLIFMVIYSVITLPFSSVSVLM